MDQKVNDRYTMLMNDGSNNRDPNLKDFEVEQHEMPSVKEELIVRTAVDSSNENTCFINIKDIKVDIKEEDIKEENIETETDIYNKPNDGEGVLSDKTVVDKGDGFYREYDNIEIKEEELIIGAEDDDYCDPLGNIDVKDNISCNRINPMIGLRESNVNTSLGTEFNHENFYGRDIQGRELITEVERKYANNKMGELLYETIAGTRSHHLSHLLTWDLTARKQFDFGSSYPHSSSHLGERNLAPSEYDLQLSRKRKQTQQMTFCTGAKNVEYDACRNQFNGCYSTEQDFKCKECDKQFSKKSNLTQHLVTHTGEQNFKCEECGKPFARKDSLTKHMLTHSGERNFECEDCGKQFAWKSNLTRHLLTHTGERNFECKECRKQFARKSHLTRHLVTHTGK